MSFYKRKQDKELNYKLEYILHWAKKIKAINMLGGKCEKCGETKPWLLAFHHVDPNEKEFEIGILLEGRWTNIESELHKCICVCSNCHRELHDSFILNETNHQYNKNLALNYKNSYKCSICEYNKCINALDFHHIDPITKTIEISKLLIYECESFERLNVLKTELDKCILLCSNCHKTLHFDITKFNIYKSKIYEKSNNIREIQPKLNKIEILNMYNNGNGVVEISKHFNASKGTISEILRGLGKGESMNDIIIDENKFLEYYKLGYTNKEIGEKLNCNKRSLFKYYKKYNIKSNKKRYNHPKNMREILEYRKQNKSMREIGLILGISQVAVLKRLQKYEKMLLTNQEDDIKL